MPRPFLTAAWRYLAMLNYQIDPSILSPLAPRGTELDLWHDQAIVSVVGFRFINTRLGGCPIPFHRDFDEVNLRFYVRREANGESRRGVVFIREIVPRAMIAMVARRFYNEPYRAMPMRHDIGMDEAHDGKPGSVTYAWRDAGWSKLVAKTAGPPQPLMAGSEEEFISEHYWGYTAQRDGGCLEYRVDHPPWRVWQTNSAALDCDIAGLYGAQFCEALSEAPRSAFVAEGSDVMVGRGVRITVGD